MYSVFLPLKILKLDFADGLSSRDFLELSLVIHRHTLLQEDLSSSRALTYDTLNEVSLMIDYDCSNINTTESV